MKRTIDIAVAAAALVLLSPLLLVIAAAIWFDSGRPVFFRQQRLGRGFRPFMLWKFRSMRPVPGSLVTAAGDERVTRVGRSLRRAKIDELPQLWNVLRGDMSLVGPRPEVSEFVDLYRGRYDCILRVRPGLTDLASIRYRDEEELLADSRDPVREYVTFVLPHKLDLAERYVHEKSLSLDLRIILQTLRAIARV